MCSSAIGIPSFEKRPVIAVRAELPGEIEPQRIVDRIAEQPPQAVAAARAQHDTAVRRAAGRPCRS